MPADPAEVSLFAGVGMTVFDDVDAITRWTRQTVHALLNLNHS
nr:hypothetical protein [Deinococcus sp. QL22]